MAKTYLQKGEVLDLVVSGSAVVSGEMIRIGSRLGVALQDGAVGDTIAVQIAGVWRLPKTTANVVAVGDMLNFDASSAELTTGATAAAGDLTDAAMAVAASDGSTSVVDALLGNFGTPS